mmetsp:Transcript_14401/g.46190  ORF Transcript_14401/g.46190 Transcript_14401/m.46190 type:complete len:170 (-) Transcript_14401:139-648(-)
MRGLVLLISAVGLAAALQSIPPPSVARPFRLSPPRAALSDNEPKKTGEDGDALAAEFARRLEAEGGATKFKLKTDISRAVEPLKDGLTDVAREAKNVQLPDVTNASPQTLLGGLFGVVFLCTLLSAASGPSVDLRTSDGTTLEFGQRSELRQPDFGTSNRGYRPEFGNQ